MEEKKKIKEDNNLNNSSVAVVMVDLSKIDHVEVLMLELIYVLKNDTSDEVLAPEILLFKKKIKVFFA